MEPFVLHETKFKSTRLAEGHPAGRQSLEIYLI